MAKPARDPALFVGTRLAVELIQTARVNHERVRELADGERPRHDDIIEAAHRRLSKEVEKIEARRTSGEEFRKKYGTSEADESDS
jgi:predicted ThiF/HesA family dinucleotide-utilizing enzyme